MADPNIDALNATTLKEIYPRVVRDVFFKNSPFLAYVRNNVIPWSGGVSTDSAFIYDALIGGAYAKGQTFNLTKPETVAALTFTPRLYEVNITEYLEDVEIFNKGPQAVFSRVDLDMTNAMNTMNAIIAIALWRHGQASGSNISDDRSIHTNGISEALNNGTDPSWDGNIFSTYGGQSRNGVVGSTLNSIPKWCGDSSGAAGEISYSILAEGYQDACRGRLEPNLIVTNKAVYAYIQERLEAKQRLAQETDPIYGATGFRFNKCMVLKDDYAPSAVYGENNARLGNFTTSTFTSPASPTSRSGLPASTSCTVGEVLFMLNTDTWDFRVSDSPLFQFGFTGFKEQPDSTRVAGQMLAALTAICRDPQLNKQYYGINS